MYEPFTDRARKVMLLTNQEAQQLGHGYIGTEHVLLGLIAEGAGVAALVLKNCGVTLERAREELDKLIQRGSLDPSASIKLPQTPLTRSVIEKSMKVARQMNHRYIGTEHLLLGLLAEPDGLACWVLLRCGLSIKRVRDEVADVLGVDRAVVTV
ncbi:MAG TPA: Clp protease N-terminal domain-containing protein [Pirellulales bacterium]|nr:Clp protease N-terminal domain-containing protein [Pirellulales bacterium]